MNSMTGFGRAQGDYKNLSFTIEINSVNRRNYEVSFSLPREWQSLEKPLNDVLKDKVYRGKINASVYVSSSNTEQGIQWDDEALKGTLARLQILAESVGSPWPPDGDALLRAALLHKNDFKLPEADEVLGSLKPLFEEAVEQFLAMKGAEGAALEADLRSRILRLIEARNEIETASKGTVGRYREMLLQRLGQAGLEIDLNDERVLKEIALFADKCDLSEEITRLASHFEQFLETLDAGDSEPIGRKLEFILQEVHREFNTVGSKANNVVVNRLVIEAKNELERIREQIQNVE